MFRIFVCGVAAVSVLCSPVLVFAARGPCTVTIPYESRSTIRCDGGVCLGMVYTTPTQSACENVNENVCTPSNPPLISKVTYESKKVSRSAAEVAANAGLGAACALCAIGVIAVLGGVFKHPVPSNYIRAIEAACGATCAVACLSMDGCWFVSCEQDASTRNPTYGGSGCS